MRTSSFFKRLVLPRISPSRVLPNAMVLAALAGAGRALTAQTEWRRLPDLVPGRIAAAAAYDPVRKRVVMFGGVLVNSMLSRGVTLNDTWEWDGTNWEPRVTSLTPPGRMQHSMAYDPVRKTVLLFGGHDGSRDLNDTWAWDGRAWTQLSPRNAPSPRHSFAMACDPIRRKVVLFGGETGLYWNSTVHGDTWEWDGQTWALQTPRIAPVARGYHAMAFDRGSGRTVMFGGGAYMTNAPSDTWEWTGTDWIRHATSSNSGPAGYGYRMASDPTGAGGVIHLSRSQQTSNVETWRWNGKAWSLVTTAGPDPTWTVLVSDETRREVIRFAGAFSNDDDGDTWSWNGNKWQKVHAWLQPTGDFDPVAVHDAARDQFVVLSLEKTPTGPEYETWAYDGQFRKLSPARPLPRPTNYLTPRCVYHQALKSVFLLGEGGRTFLWDGATWKEHVSTSHPMVDSPLAYDSGRDRVVAVSPAVSPRSTRTWEWEKTSGWTERTPQTIPPAGLLAYDPRRRQTVLHSSTRGTWEWDGTNWTQMRPLATPKQTLHDQLVYVPALKGVMLFGGFDWSTVRALTGAWLWDGITWKSVPGAKLPSDYPVASSDYDPGRQRLVAFYRAQSEWRPDSVAYEFRRTTLKTTQLYPRLGERISFDVNLGSQANRPFALLLSQRERPGIPLIAVQGVGVELLPLAPDALLNLSLQVGMFAILDKSGNARLPFAIPQHPALLGYRFHVAGVTFKWQGGFGAVTHDVPIQVVQ